MNRFHCSQPADAPGPGSATRQDAEQAGVDSRARDANGEIPLVLVVEDNPDLNRFIVDTLVEDYRVVSAVDGRQGLADAVALQPDLIITELMMPVSSAEDLVHRLRSQTVFDATPIVALSASGDDTLRTRLLGDGVQDCLTPPLRADELRARVARQLAARKLTLDSSRGSEERLTAEVERRVAARTAQLHRLVRELEAAGQRERRQLARDLHDDLAQILAAARIRLDPLVNHPHPEVHVAARRVDDLIRRADASTRVLAAQLAPAMLYELGLKPALDWLAQDVGRSLGLQVAVVDDGLEKPLAQEARAILYRAVRELLIDLAEHACTDAALVELARERNQIVLRVSDGGAGFDPARLLQPTRRAQGLVCLPERLSLIGGAVEVRSMPGTGTVVVLSAPLASDHASPSQTEVQP